MENEDHEESCFRLAAAGGRPVADEVRARVAERMARGVLAREEVERVGAWKLGVLRGDPVASEAFRQCCIAWEVDRTVPLVSHRPIVGPVIVALKKIVRRALRFQNEATLARQRDFNWNLLRVLRELLERAERERTR